MVEGKGPVSGPRIRWYTHLLPGTKGGEAILTGANVRARSEITTLKPPAARRWLLMGRDNIFQSPVRFDAHRPVGLRIETKDLPTRPGIPDGDQMGPQHLETEDIQGTNPKDRGIVLGADPLGPRFEDAGSLRMGPFERTAHPAAPRRMGLFQELFFFELWHAPKAPLLRREETFRITAEADVRQTRAPRLLAMVMKVLKFDVSAWLRGNRK